MMPSFAQMSLGMPQDTTLTDAERGNAYCRDADK
jgi:hypothetical protein